jgi:hypothetical protein
MRTRLLGALGALVLLLTCAPDASAQGVKGKFPLSVRGGPSQQNTARVDTSTTPQRFELGCEVDQEGGTTVNGLRFTGNTATNNPTIATFGCPNGGDASPSLTLAPAGALTLLGNPSATPATETLSGQPGTGTNIAGGKLTLRGGNGTGTGGSGGFEIDVAYPGGSGAAADTFSAAFNAFATNNQAAGAAFANQFFLLTATVNQSGTAGYCFLCGSVTETATGSGAKNLIELQVGGSDKFVVDDTGQITTGFLGARTDIVQFYMAVTECTNDTLANLKPTRVAPNDWALARTAAGAETYQIACHLNAPTRTTAGKGWKLTAFSISQFIGTAALTSNTFNALSTVAYANNVANAVAAYGGSITITMPTATQANPYLTAGTVGTPAFMNTTSAAIDVDFTVVMQNTGVYRLYGISATWTQQD